MTSVRRLLTGWDGVKRELIYKRLKDAIETDGDAGELKDPALSGLLFDFAHLVICADEGYPPPTATGAELLTAVREWLAGDWKTIEAHRRMIMDAEQAQKKHTR